MNIINNDEDYKREVKEKVILVIRKRGRMSRDGTRTSAFWRGSTELNIQLNEAPLPTPTPSITLYTPSKSDIQEYVKCVF